MEKFYPANWDEVAQIISNVMEHGIEKPYKRVFKKVLEVENELVEVIYITDKGIRIIGNAWVVS